MDPDTGVLGTSTKNVLGSAIPLTPQCCVFDISGISKIPTTQQRFLHETLIQARKLIAGNWMNDHMDGYTALKCPSHIRN